MAKSRDTRQRAAIKKAFESCKRPLGPKEVLEIAGQFVPNLGIATVYRNIKSMVDQNELMVFDLPGQAPCYYLPVDKHAPLFVDEKTGKVYFIDDSQLKIEMPESMDEFKIKRYEVFFYGEHSDSSETVTPSYMGSAL